MSADRGIAEGRAGRLDGVGPEDSALVPSQRVPEPLAQLIGNRPGTLRQICRSGKVAIYEGPARGEYEVVIIRVEKARLIRGVPYPDREIYPAPEDWGSDGWTYTENSHPNALSAARARMRACLERPGEYIGTLRAPAVLGMNQEKRRK